MGALGLGLGAEAGGYPGEWPWASLITSHLMSQGVIQGTIPYLGTFLTDLVMLDTAMKDYLYVSELGAWWGGARALKPRRTVPLTEP